MGAAGYASAPARALTPRMRDVLRCAAGGQTAQQTALELGLSVSTVWSIRAALCARLDVANVTAAAVAAMRRGELH